jgi:hypothetical protein
MSQQLDGSWVGRFSCGPAQGAVIKAAISALSAPRPGKAIDAHGVEQLIPDLRDLGARQLDALTELVIAGAAKGGIDLPPAHGRPGNEPAEPDVRDLGGPGKRDEEVTQAPCSPDPDRWGHASETGDLHDRDQAPDPRRDPGSGRPGTDLAYQCEPHAQPDVEHAPAPEGERDPEAPEPEGEYQLLRSPGVLATRFPTVELVLVAGIEHVAAALALHKNASSMPAFDLEDLPDAPGLPDLGPRLRRWLDAQPPAVSSGPTNSPGRQAEQLAAAHLLDDDADDCAGDETRPPGARNQQHAGSGEGSDQTSNPSGQPPQLGVLAALHQGWEPTTAPARIEHAGLVDRTTLQLLACNPVIRTVLLTPNGAVLDLGRTQRLASARQRTALLARDGGCIIPGCTVPGDGCEAHHVVPWDAGGPTDVDNLVLLCDRHHSETHQRTWEVHMVAGVPWVRLPSWMDRTRPLVRNATHRHPRRRQGQ